MKKISKINIAMYITSNVESNNSFVILDILRELLNDSNKQINLRIIFLQQAISYCFPEQYLSIESQQKVKSLKGLARRHKFKLEYCSRSFIGLEIENKIDTENIIGFINIGLTDFIQQTANFQLLEF